MFKAPILLLLTLLLNVELSSSAPINEGPLPVADEEPHLIVSDEQVQAVAEEAAPEEPVQADWDHNPIIVKEQVSKELIPVTAEEAAPTVAEDLIPEKPALVASNTDVAEELIPVITEEATPNVAENPIPEEPAIVASNTDVAEELIPAITEEAAPNVVEDPIPEEPAIVASNTDVAEEPIPVITEEAAPTVAEEPMPVEPAVVVSNTDVAEEPLAEEHILSIAEEPAFVGYPVPVETDADAPDEVIAEKSAPQESAAVAPVASEEDSALVEAVFVEASPDEVSVFIVPPVAIVESTTENTTPEELILIVLEEDTEKEPASSQKPVDMTQEKKESVVDDPAEFEAEESVQVEPALEETDLDNSTPEEPAVSIPMESAEDEPDLEKTGPEELIPSILLDDSVEEASEEKTQEAEAAIPLNNLPAEPASEEDAAPEDSDPEVPTIPAPLDTATETLTYKEGVDPDEEIPVAVNQAPVAPENLTESTNEQSALEAEAAPASAEPVNGTSVAPPKEDLNTTVTSLEDETDAHVSRGLVLGAAFFTVVSLIAIGSVGRAVSRKMR